MPGRNCGKVFSPERIVILPIVEVHVAEFSNVKVTEIVLVILVPRDVARPVWRRNSAPYRIFCCCCYAVNGVTSIAIAAMLEIYNVAAV